MIKKSAKEYEAEPRQRTANIGNDDSTNPCPVSLILKYFERYGKHLFGHPTLRDEDGTILAVVERTNNVPEHFFGAEKRKLRRRLGRAHQPFQGQKVTTDIAHTQRGHKHRTILPQLSNLANNHRGPERS